MNLVAKTSPDITVAGSLLPSTWYTALRSMRVQRELCVVGRATLRFADDGYKLAESSLFSLGAEVKIDIRDDGPIFAGVVVGAAVEQRVGQSPELVITVDDRGYALAHHTRIQPHLQRTTKDLISTLASDAALTASVDVTDGEVYEHILQRSNDLDFLDMLVRRCNAVWWVDDTKLIVRPIGAQASTFTISQDDVMDGVLQDFSVRASALRSPDMKVLGWDSLKKEDVVGKAASVSKDSTTSAAPFVTKYSGRSSTLDRITTDTSITTAANPGKQGEAEHVAKSLLAASHAEGAIARGTLVPGAAKVTLTTNLKVDGVGPISGTYLITGVEHVYNSAGFVTRFVAGPVRPSGLVDTLGPAQFDAGLTMGGLTTAVVSDGRDPDGLGRVKVKYVGVGENVVSDWARVLSLGGGGKRGMVIQPEVNDEVLVGFERGDTRRPVVLGGLFATKDDVAADNNLTDTRGKVAYRRVTSRLGHVLELADGQTPADQHIMLKLGNIGHKLRLGADEMTIDLEQGKPFTLKVGNAKIGIDAQGNIAIEGMKITLKATQDVSIEGINASITGTKDVKIAANMNAELTGTLKAAVQSSAQAVLKGAVVMIN